MSEVATHLEKLGQIRILCVGDVMLDRFVTGEARRLSPEAPVPVLRIGRRQDFLGGAGNVVRNLAALGVPVSFVAVIGTDDPGRGVAHAVENLPALEPFLAVAEGYNTPEKTRFLTDDGHYLLRADLEDATGIGAEAERQVIDAARAAVAGADAVILSDYAKGTLTDAVLSAVIEAARGQGLPVVVDPKGRDFGRYRGARLLTPNFREFCAAVGEVPADEPALIACARAMMAAHDLGGILVTRGAQGMTLIDGAQGTVSHYPAQAREVSDVTGAGDTVAATMVALLAAGADAPVAALCANMAAGLVVARPGTAVATRRELAAALRGASGSAVERKVCDLEALVARVADLKAAGQVVGFTNGCFDLLHPGHIHLLHRARELCDHLIVGLNSDASVARLKGPTRPVQGEAARALVLASLADVDSVCLFADDTPLEMIRALLPDVLVKGADYTPETVVGAPEVIAAGGRLELVDLKDGFSTSSTIARLRSEDAGG